MEKKKNIPEVYIKFGQLNIINVSEFFLYFCFFKKASGELVGASPKKNILVK